MKKNGKKIDGVTPTKKHKKGIKNLKKRGKKRYPQKRIFLLIFDGEPASRRRLATANGRTGTKQVKPVRIN